MTYNSLPPATRAIFEKLSKRAASSYILDYVTAEYEAIISCPSVVDDYFSNPKSLANDYNITPRVASYETSGLPSPPLSSPEKKALSNHCYNNYQRPISYPPTPSNIPPVSLRSYIESVVKKSRIDTGTLLSSLAYARRLKSKLAHTSKGMECTHHRIFLATLIISSKYIHDSALKNKYWVHYAQIFSASEINLMEKQLLQLLVSICNTRTKLKRILTSLNRTITWKSIQMTTMFLSTIL
ncbi:unnamed protein product [Mucor hiemalis]